MTASTPEILQAYRRLFRHGLYAVQYATPSRYVVRDELRQAFRTGSTADFDAKKIENTVAFLSSAAEERGTAHKILKTFLEVRWWRQPQRQ